VLGEVGLQVAHLRYTHAAAAAVYAASSRRLPRMRLHACKHAVTATHVVWEEQAQLHLLDREGLGLHGACWRGACQGEARELPFTLQQPLPQAAPV